MDLRELETFRAVVEAGGVARAAQRLHRAQSSVTARLRQLEASLGVALFRREGRRLALTPAGDALVDYAGRMLELADETRQAVRRDGVCGRVRLGTMESTAASRLPRPLASFHGAHPRVAVELQTAPSRDLLSRLQAGELDLIVAGDDVDRSQFVATPLYRETLVLVAAAGAEAHTFPQALAGGTLLVFRGQGCAYRRRLDAWLAHRRIVPGRTLEYASYHAILASAAAGVGVCLVPQSVLDIYPQRDALSVHALPARFARLPTLLIRRRDQHRVAVAQLAEHLRRDARSASPQQAAA
ncbi:LysR substrate-binding domain-containing protein [Oleiagrimonas sp. C23AA]|uniref:LysR substrate-binding domain-containing protein n=1 Tax=Oleiagrimonas sp. C23AA TaxID=2719047 RepID=UPI0014218E72|nr:LysR substrate-binding domain-containing protein [Oleiagrimonas sp. C23AA]NII11895.1 LysR family transcriptional regulator [Oleiagrimonas sp. C23AA]